MKLNVKSLLKNKYVLYATLFIAITNVLGYLALNDFRSLAFFVGVAMLSTYFSKNMIINLGSAILITNIVFGKSILEGMENNANAEEADEAEPDEKPANKCKEGYQYLTQGEHKGCCKKGDKLNGGGKCIGSKGAGYEPEPALESFTQKNIPSSTPAAADESVEDEQIGKRVDYASTLEQAYNNLENVLGKKGIDGLAKETKSLIGQQKNLMKTLDTMTPVLKNAQATIKSFDLESLTKNLGSLGNLMKQN